MLLATDLNNRPVGLSGKSIFEKVEILLKKLVSFLIFDPTVVDCDSLDRARPSNFLFGSVSVHWTFFNRGRMRRHAPDLSAL